MAPKHSGPFPALGVGKRGIEDTSLFLRWLSSRPPCIHALPRRDHCLDPVGERSHHISLGLTLGPPQPVDRAHASPLQAGPQGVMLDSALLPIPSLCSCEVKEGSLWASTDRRCCSLLRVATVIHSSPWPPGLLIGGHLSPSKGFARPC